MIMASHILLKPRFKKKEKSQFFFYQVRRVITRYRLVAAYSDTQINYYGLFVKKLKNYEIKFFPLFIS